MTGIVTSPEPLPSGTPLTLTLAETYRFLNGKSAAPESVTQDLVGYQPAGAPAEARALFPATPSLVFEAIALQSGVITASIFAPGAETGAAIVGADGGTIAGPSGEQFIVPVGAAPATPVAMTTLDEASAGLVLPPGVSWLAGVTLAFSGELELPGRLSIVKPAGLTGADQVLLVRVRESQGQTQYLLAARTRIDGDRLVADVTLPGSADTLDGVRLPGRYIFLQTAAPVAFSAGAVSGISGQPFSGALVTNDRLAIASLSSSAGRYAQAMPGGAVTLTALDESKRDTGSVNGTVIAGLTATIDLSLSPQPPAVASILPANGAVSVALSDPVVVRFSEPVASATVTAQAILLAGPSGPMAATLALSSGDTLATLRPAAPLEPNTDYTVTIAATITDLAGYALPAAVTSRFTTLDTTPPPAPPAGNLSATIPDGAGRTTVSGTQGTAGLHDRVTIINVTRKTSTPALVNPDGSFSAVVVASNADVLKLQITDSAGNVSSADIPAFRQVNPDGSVSQFVGQGGGHIDGPGGTAVDVFPGTFPDGAVVTVKPVPEAEFPFSLTADQAAIFSYAAGFTLDFGGASPTRYLNVSVPARPEDKPDDQWIIGQTVTVDGETRLSMVDTAKLIGGRVTTSSPPCPGVLAAGMFGVYKSAKSLGVAYGTGAMQQTADMYRAIATGDPAAGSVATPAGAVLRLDCDVLHGDSERANLRHPEPGRHRDSADGAQPVHRAGDRARHGGGPPEPVELLPRRTVRAAGIAGRACRQPPRGCDRRIRLAP